MQLKLKTILPIVGAFLLAVALATGSFFAGQWYKGKNLSLPERQPQTSCEGCIKPLPAPDISNWKTYRNEELGFEVKIPEGFIVSDFTQKHKESLKEAYRQCEEGLVSGCGGGGPEAQNVLVFTPEENTPKEGLENSYHIPYIFSISLYNKESLDPGGKEYGGGEEFKMGNVMGRKITLNYSGAGITVPHRSVEYRVLLKSSVLQLEFSSYYTIESYSKWMDAVASSLTQIP